MKKVILWYKCNCCSNYISIYEDDVSKIDNFLNVVKLCDMCKNLINFKIYWVCN